MRSPLTVLSRVQGDWLSAWVELPADLETPVSVYAKLSEGARSAFLLESVTPRERFGRFSFIGADPEAVIWGVGDRVFIKEGERLAEHRVSDPLGFLQSEMSRDEIPAIPELPPFQGGYVGYLGYDCVRHIERLPATLEARGDAPDFCFLRVREFVAFDSFEARLVAAIHVRIGTSGKMAALRTARARLFNLVDRLNRPLPAALRFLRAPKKPAVFVPESEAAEYAAQVERIKAYIRAGDVFQTVLSTEFREMGTWDPLSLYRVLRKVNPSPYLYLLKLGSLSIVGSSPEIMVRKEGSKAILRPIAGTRRRGKTRDEDLAMEAELRADPKENAEHVMLLDLGRNDLGRVCVPGTIDIPEDHVVERYSHVMHIVSEVTGTLLPGVTPFDLLRATFPAGTLSGAPKVRAMEIIEELEKSRRGIYGGSVGYIGFDGNMDMAITIRTLVVHPDCLVLRAGAGIVADSDPRLEYKECQNKARALMRVCEILSDRNMPCSS